MPVIEADNLEYHYRSGKGIESINLRVDNGECVGLLGRNGSGKSTLIRLIMGLEKGYSGVLRVLGHDPGDGPGRHLLRIGYAMDRCVHWESLSGWENAWFFAKSYKIAPDSIERRLKELFTIADLWDRAGDPVKEYSYGMRRKLTLIEALCHNPELLVLDEPTSGADAHFQNRLSDLVRLRTEGGLTTLIAGNDPDWISGITTGLAFMDSGRILVRGTEEEFLKELSPLQRVHIRLRRPVHIPDPPVQRVRRFKQSGRDLSVVLEKDPMLLPVILEWIVVKGGEVSDLEVHRGTLRDSFLLKTGEILEQ